MSNIKSGINKLAPIVLFVYNRPWHTEQTLKALKANDLASQSILYVFSDGPKHMALNKDIENIEKVRSIVKSKQWCKEVSIRESEHHKGLADSIVHGVTEIVNKHGKVIVLEDDIITSKGFLKYMNDALTLYANEKSVMHISGYKHPVDIKIQETTFFSKTLSCWGWGTWKRAWGHYHHDINDHINYFSAKRSLRKKFDIYGHANFYKQLIDNKKGRIYSWAVRWYASWLRQGGYALFPNKSLVQNIGFDDSGKHCSETNHFEVDMVDSIDIKKIEIKENTNIRKKLDRFYKSIYHKDKGVKKTLKRYFYININIIRKVFRWILIKLFPELRRLISPNINWSIIESSKWNSQIGHDVRLIHPYYLRNSSIGDYTNINHSSRILNTDIGKFTCIGPHFYSGKGIHPFDCLSTHSMFYSTQDQHGLRLSKIDKVQETKRISIGNDVFIGMNVIVLDGVTIGDGAVIAAGSIVSKDVPPYAIAVGSPIRVMLYRFDKEIIEELLKIKWWDWEVEDLKKVEENFFDIKKFISKFKN